MSLYLAPRLLTEPLRVKMRISIAEIVPWLASGKMAPQIPAHSLAFPRARHKTSVPVVPYNPAFIFAWTHMSICPYVRACVDTYSCRSR